MGGIIANHWGTGLLSNVLTISWAEIWAVKLFKGRVLSKALGKHGGVQLLPNPRCNSD